jgi:hypothetical protein
MYISISKWRYPPKETLDSCKYIHSRVGILANTDPGKKIRERANWYAEHMRDCHLHHNTWFDTKLLSLPANKQFYFEWANSERKWVYPLLCDVMDDLKIRPEGDKDLGKVNLAQEIRQTSYVDDDTFLKKIMKSTGGVQEMCCLG